MELFSKEHYERNISDLQNNLKAFESGKVKPKLGEIAANQKALEQEKKKLEELMVGIK